jgi:hypothetical protein
MKRKAKAKYQGEEHLTQPHRVRLPGFLTEEEIGLGDIVKRVTYAFGVRPCPGCEQRAAALNHWMVFGRGNE